VTARRRVGCVLVVEDEEHIRETVKDALEEEGCTVLSAANGADALAVLQDDCPDVILLDMRMPIMDGWQAVAYMRTTFVANSAPPGSSSHSSSRTTPSSEVVPSECSTTTQHSSRSSSAAWPAVVGDIAAQPSAPATVSTRRRSGSRECRAIKPWLGKDQLRCRGQAAAVVYEVEAIRHMAQDQCCLTSGEVEARAANNTSQ
jgi:hypothetical protein